MLNPLDSTNIPLAGLHVLVPKVVLAEPWQDAVANARAKSTRPFLPNRVQALDALSKDLLRHPRLRRDAAGAALGFWLRRAHLTHLEQEFSGRTVPGRRVAAGLVFHIAPGNVDTMFIYSWALSFLAGNANVVRLTSDRSPLMNDLLECLDRVVIADPSVFSGNFFVSYGHDEATTEYLSAQCDLRIVWGGDETVRRIRAIPLNPHASERAFASKRSLTVISSHEYALSDEAARKRLADRFAGDIAPFGQMACSSPHVIFWFGTAEAGEKARQDFESSMQAAMAAKSGEPDLAQAVRRLNHAFNSVAEGRAVGMNHTAHMTHIRATNPTSAESAEVCGAGLLAHGVVESLEALQPLLRRDHQTITYYGLNPAELDALVTVAGSAGVDRIVPIGRALDFGPYWDGYSLWDDLVRTVVVE